MQHREHSPGRRRSSSGSMVNEGPATVNSRTPNPQAAHSDPQEDTALTITPFMVVCFVCMMCTMLICLYFFFNQLGKHTNTKWEKMRKSSVSEQNKKPRLLPYKKETPIDDISQYTQR